MRVGNPPAAGPVNGHVDIGLRKNADAWLREHQAQHLVADVAFFRRLASHLYRYNQDKALVRRTAVGAISQYLMDTGSRDEAMEFRAEIDAYYAGRPS